MSSHHAPNPSAGLREEIHGWRTRLERLPISAGLKERADRGPIYEPLHQVDRRLGEGPGAPARIPFFGPTGAGKSKLFNSLVGQAVSPSSYRRPCTRKPIYFVHRSWQGRVGEMRGEVRWHELPDFEGVILIDTPDFDSVEADNRALARQVYLEADAFVFVADVHKYADASVWQHLKEIHTEGKKAAFVLNKVGQGSDPESAAADFRRRLGEAFGPEGPPGPVLSVAERPQGDDELLPQSEEGLAALRKWIVSLGAPGDARRGLLADSLHIDLSRILREWEVLSRPLAAYRAGAAKLLSELGSRVERSTRDLTHELTGTLDPGLKSELYREVLKRVEKLDVLRYPRRLLSLPAMGLRKALSRLWPQIGGTGRERAAGDEVLDAANLALLEDKIRDLVEETARSARGEIACPGLLGDEEIRSFRLDHAALRDRYQAVEREFKSWAETQAKSTAATLTAEHKAKFILSQLLYNTVVISVQVKTAGTLTLGEMVTDGVLSPLVAKAVGMAVSSERVAQFEEEARGQHARRLAALLKEAGDQFACRLSAEEAGLAPLGQLGSDLEGLRTSIEAASASYREGRK